MKGYQVDIQAEQVFKYCHTLRASVSLRKYRSVLFSEAESCQTIKHEREPEWLYFLAGTILRV